MALEDRRRLDRLNDYLDDANGMWPATPSTPDLGLDPTLVETVRRVHALPDASSPAPDLQAQLWEDLMSASTATFSPPGGAYAPAAAPFHITARTASTAVLQNKRRRWALPVTEVAAAAVVLFTLATGYLLYGGGRSPGDERSSAPAAWQGGTPSGDGEMVSFAACDIQPRDESFYPLGEEQPSGPPSIPAAIEGGIAEDQVPTGDSASARVEGQLTDALRQLTACRYYDRPYDTAGPEGRYFALLSDDYFRRALADESSGVPYTFYYWRPWDDTPATIERTVALADGRVGAVVVDREFAGFGRGPEAEFRYFMVFVEDDGRWLIDEAYQFSDPDAKYEPGTPQTISSASDEPDTLVLVLRGTADTSVFPGRFEDLAAAARPSYADGGMAAFDFPPDADVTLVLHNVGTVPQRVESAALDINVEVRPMTTEEIVVNAPAGEYLIAAYLDGEENALGGVTRLILTDEEPNPLMG